MADTDESILEELREQFLYGTNEWNDVREEGDADMRCLAGDVWDPAERKEREDAKRPCLSPDELTQYVNQLINDVRSNKRGIKVTAQGNGATDKTAEFRQGLMRQIEYESNAQQAAYIIMGENAFQRSYGFLRIRAEYVSDRGFDQRLRIDPLPDPNLVTLDPDIILTNGKDAQWGFIGEMRATKKFLVDFPHAEIRNFGAEMQTKAGKHWFAGDRIQVAEYWKIVTEKRRLLLLEAPPAQEGQPPQQPIAVFEDELEDEARESLTEDQVLQEREVDAPRVRQYLTNGLELLRPKGQKQAYTEWPGKSIPIVPCFGKVMYLRENGETKRKMLSLIRLARDPAMMHAFIATIEAELVQMTPKTPFVGYKGQFRGMESDWARVHNEPLAYLEVNPVTEKTGAQVLPLPERQPYDPPIQQLEISREAWRRSIQAAVGISPLPTAAQRQTEKSGVALERIDSQQQKGSFHFIDHYNEAITRTAQILEELIPHYYDTARDVTVRKPDDTPAVQRINDPTAKEHVAVGDEEHDVTLSTGPSFDSQREAASDFVDSLSQNPQIFAQIGDLLVKLKDLGPTGDEIAERLTPPQYRKQPGQEDLPPQVRAMFGQANQKIQELTQQLSQAIDEIKTEQVKAQTAKAIKQMDIDFQERKLARDSETKIAVAELSAKVDRLALFLQERDRIGMHAEATADRAHDVGMAVLSHEQGLQQQDQAQGHALEQIAAQPQPAPAAGAAE